MGLRMAFSLLLAMNNSSFQIILINYGHWKLLMNQRDVKEIFIATLMNEYKGPSFQAILSLLVNCKGNLFFLENFTTHFK